MTLKILDGGKTSAPAANGGAGDDGRFFRKHPLAESLWRAVYPKDADNHEQIAERMSKVCRREIEPDEVTAVIRHVRDYAFDYGWTIPPVQMGSGEFRKYFPVLVDHDGLVIDDAGHAIYVQKGAVSFMRATITRNERAAAAWEIFSGSPHLERGDKRKFRAIAAVLDGVTTMMQDALKKVV